MKPLKAKQPALLVKPPETPDFSGVEQFGNNDALILLPQMVATLRDLQRTAEKKLADATTASAALTEYETITLPNAMEAAGVKSFELADGSVLKVKPDIKASIKIENRPQAYGWLRETGNGGVIKTSFVIDVRVLEDDERDALTDAILKAAPGVAVEHDESVHPSTLKSLCKQLLEEGKETPPAINIFEFKKASLKEPKGS